MTEQLFQQALHLHQSGDLDGAKNLYSLILKDNPDHPAALHFLGVLCCQADDLETARELIQKAIDIEPDYADAHTNLGLVLKGLGRTGEAVEAYRKALVISPQNPAALVNLGNFLSESDDFAGARDAYEEALALEPDNAAVHANLGLVLKEQSKPREAVAALRRALELAPDLAETHHSLGMLLLQLGEFEEGWREYEWRWRDSGFLSPRKAFREPLWDGSDLQGKTILLYAEQGLGDAIQFCRFAPLVKERGATVILECPAPLVHLLENLAGVEQVIGAGGKRPAFDVQAPLLSLPGLLNTQLDTIPTQSPYLPVEAEIDAAWKNRFDRDPGLKVGLAWAGNPNHKNDRNRSIPLSVFEPMLALPDITFYSLQVGNNARDIDALPAACPITDLTGDVPVFEQLAGAISNLDVFITVDTSPAHLAGAIGAEAWLLLPVTPDWRWLLDRQESPWYPSLRLYRQDRRGDWQTVIERLCTDLRQAPA
ncbi:MAG: tetratricopeptide repeat protein [Rhodospirillales bacterium]|nr:tetratricopeptide repeat protein [Rhodospirillales bacterium]